MEKELDFDINEFLAGRKEEIVAKYEAMQAKYGVRSNKLTDEDIKEWQGR